jgi:hypothetical protein
MTTSDTVWTAGHEYAVFDNVTTSSGDLWINLQQASGGEGDVDGIQLVTVSGTPEPATIGLLGLGSLGLLSRRRSIA